MPARRRIFWSTQEASRKRMILLVFTAAALGVFSILDLAFYINVPGYQAPFHGYAFLIAIFAIAWFGYVNVGAAASIVMFPIVLSSIVLLGNTPATTGALHLVILDLLLAMVFFSRRGTILTTALNIATIVFLTVAAPEKTGGWQTAGQPLMGSILAGILAFVYLTHRELGEKERFRDTAEAEARLRLALNAAQMGLWSWDIRSGLVEMSPRVEEIFGLAEGTFDGRYETFRGHLHPDDKTHFDAAIGLALREHSGSYWVQFRVVRDDGTLRWMEGRGTVAVDDRGLPRRMQGTAVDITDQKAASAELEESRRFVRRIAEASPLLIYVYDVAAEKNVYMNRNLGVDLGFAPTEFPEPSEVMPRLMHPDDLARLPEHLAQWATVPDGGFVETEYRMRTADGSYRWFRGRDMVFEREADGRVKRIIGTAQDVTESRITQDRLQLAATVFDSSREGIIITDPDGHIRSVNAAFTAITGYTLAEVEGQNPRIFSSGLHDRAFYEDMWESIANRGFWQGEIWNRRKYGGIFPEYLSISALRDDAGRVMYYVGFFTDLTESKAAEERIEFLASRDTLTGLPNRITFRDRFEQALGRGVREHFPVALMSFDINQFQVLNSTLGPASGDLLIRAVGERLTKAAGEEATVSRQGGDEFLILQPLTDEGASDAAAAAGRLLGALREGFVANGQSISLTASIGISLFPRDGSDFDVLFQKSDAALGHAKRSGRNTYRFYEEAINLEMQHRMMMEGRLRAAVVQESFAVYFQPQFSLKSGKLSGAEALLRWYDPALGGFVPPDDFIPLAERTGLIVDIGRWVLNESCRAAVRWRSQGDPIVISVNLSALQLEDETLLSQVEAALATSGLPAEFLELELTESMLARDTETTLDRVKKLRALGIRLAIDDFGTGYSSLRYLQKFPFTRIKVDRSFTQEIDRDVGTTAIARAILRLGKSLGLSTIAEGVETEGQVAMLRAEECDEVQGFLYARALPEHEFIARFFTSNGH